MAIYSAPPSSSKPPHSSSSTSVNTGPTTINSSSSSRDVSASPNFNKQTLNPSEPLKIKKLGVLNDDGTMSDGWLFFLSCRCGTAMFPTLVWWKIKGVKIGLPETRISLSFQGVAPNLYAGQINTWTIFLRLLCTLDSHFQTILMFIIYMLYMVPDITFGQNIRVSLDVGCGVASFGAYLLSRNVITISVAPKDVHENQIQFALERGVPAMVAAFATRRLLYPSQAFDLIHCSRCRVNWTRDDGILLLEVNRMLRAGGYFVWAAQPVYKHEQNLEEQWEEMLNLTTRLCWKFLKKDGYVAIWQKPSDNSCYLNREAETKPPLCDPSDDPDNV